MELRCPYPWSSSWHRKSLSSVAKRWLQNVLAYSGALTQGKCQASNRLCSSLHCGRGSTVVEFNFASSCLGLQRLFPLFCTKSQAQIGKILICVKVRIPDQEDLFYPYSKELETLNWIALYIVVGRYLKWIVLFWRKWIEQYIRESREYTMWTGYSSCRLANH